MIQKYTTKITKKQLNSVLDRLVDIEAGIPNRKLLFKDIQFLASVLVYVIRDEQCIKELTDYLVYLENLSRTNLNRKESSE